MPGTSASFYGIQPHLNSTQNNPANPVSDAENFEQNQATENDTERSFNNENHFEEDDYQMPMSQLTEDGANLADDGITMEPIRQEVVNVVSQYQNDTVRNIIILILLYCHV